MSEQIEPGDGWRLLGPDDVLRHGDEMLFYVDGAPYWMAAPDTCFNEPKAKYFPYRRRIPAKPEAFSGKSISTYEDGPLWLMETGEEKTALDLNEAREFAAWLTRYADWREAQDAAK